jgi:hypothetical protein
MGRIKVLSLVFTPVGTPPVPPLPNVPGVFHETPLRSECPVDSETLETPEASRRRVLQMLGAAGLAGLPAWSFGQPTASVNTTKLAVTDTEVTVGQLHSSTGTMAISETGSIQAEQLAIDEINAMGGILGRKIKVIKEDGASDWPTFAEKSKKLLINDKVRGRVRLLDLGLAQGRAAGVREG